MTHDQAQSPRLGQRVPIEATYIQVFDVDPSTPTADLVEAAWPGMLIFRNDTSMLMIYDGVARAWREVTGGVAGQLTYVGPSMPAGLGYSIGDTWYDSDAGMKAYVWDGDSWEPTVSGIMSFRQPEPPTSTAIGDIWYDSDDGQKMYRANVAGSSAITVTVPPDEGWVLVRDEDIDEALGQANSAQAQAAEALADAEIAVEAAEAAAAAAAIAQTAANQALLDAAAAEQTGDDAQDAADQAQADATAAATAAANAIIAANAAQATANGKANIYYQSTAPTVGMVAEDLWVDTDDGVLHVYQGGTWVVTQDTNLLTQANTQASSLASAAQAAAIATASADATTKANAAQSTAISTAATDATTKAAAAQQAAIDAAYLADSLITNPTRTGTTTGWTVAGSGTGALVVENVDYNGTTVRAMKFTSSQDQVAGTGYFKVDPTKAYMIRFWVKDPVDPAGAQFYLGTNQLNLAGGGLMMTPVPNATGVAGTATTNFYHYSSAAAQAGWVEWVGYVLPPGTDPLSMMGLGKSNASASVSNAIMASNIDRMQWRILNYANAGTPRDLWIYSPSVIELSPEEVKASSRTALWEYTGTVKLDGGDIQADTVAAAQITALAITSKHTLTGPLIQTEATAARGVKISTTGLVGYTNGTGGFGVAGTATFVLDATTGALTMIGPIQTGGTITGALFQTSVNPLTGVKIGPAGFTIYNTSGVPVLNFDAGTGNLVLTGAIQAGSTITGASLVGNMTVTGGTLQTDADANEGIKINNAGMVAYDNTSHTAKFTVNGTTGDVILAGNLTGGGFITGPEFRTDVDATTGIHINSTGLYGYDALDQPTFVLDAVTGDLTLRGTIDVGSQIIGAEITGSIINGSLLQTSPDPGVGIKISDSGFAAYGPNPADPPTVYIDPASGTITTRGAMLTGGNITGSQLNIGAISINPTSGIVIPQPGGGTISLPADGSEAVITAQLVATALTAKNNTALQDLISLYGQMKVANGIVDPAVAPTLQNVWTKLQGPTVAGYNYRGLWSYDLTHWIRVAWKDTTKSYIDWIDKSSGSLTNTVELTGFVAYGGLVKIGAYYWILGYDYSGGDGWEVRQYDLSAPGTATATGTSWHPSFNPGASWLTIGADGSGNPVVAYNDSNLATVDDCNSASGWSGTWYWRVNASSSWNGPYPSTATLYGSAVNVATSAAPYGETYAQYYQIESRRALTIDTSVNKKVTVVWYWDIYPGFFRPYWAAQQVRLLLNEGTDNVYATAISTPLPGAYSAVEASFEVPAGINTLNTIRLTTNIYTPSGSIGDGILTSVYVDQVRTSQLNTGIARVSTYNTSGVLASTDSFTVPAYESFVGYAQGSFDFGASRHLLYGSWGVWSYELTGALARTRHTEDEWTLAAAPNSLSSVHWDGTRFWSHHSDAAIYKYETGHIASSTIHSRYTWADVVGTLHETAGSPPNSLAWNARAGVKIIGKPPPQGNLTGAEVANMMKIYVGTSAADTRLQPTQPAQGVDFFTYPTIDLTGAVAPTTNNWGVLGSVGTVESTNFVADLSGWRLKGDGEVRIDGYRTDGAWTTYTPALTGMALNNGTLTAAWQRVGKSCTFRVLITFGTSTGISGAVQVGIPFTSKNVTSQLVHCLVGSSGGGAPWYGFGWIPTSSNTVYPHIPQGAANNVQGNLGSFGLTMGTNSYISMEGTYEVA